jgi:hypothetical protein
VDETGTSYREQLEGLLSRAKTEERRADLADQLKCPDLPTALAYLWQAFAHLSQRRQVGFGPSPIMWSEIRAYCDLSGLKLRPWEVFTILDLDDVYLTDRAKRDQK